MADNVLVRSVFMSDNSPMGAAAFGNRWMPDEASLRAARHSPNLLGRGDGLALFW